jgi:radical SAM superfamily enzyme YgiQ (UPF0313 family)
MAKEIERILLIEPKSPNYHVFSKFTIPRLGLPQLGAILKKEGYTVKIILEELEPKKRMDYDKIGDYNPDLVGISTITSTAPHAYLIADKIKGLFKVPVVFGGAHPSFMPEEALRHGDYVVRKEADTSFLQLIKTLNSNGRLEDIKGISFKAKTGFVHNLDSIVDFDLDSLPDPDLTLIDNNHKLDMIPIDTSRGCPYGCSFCTVIKMFGRAYRFKSPKKVIENIKQYPGKPIFIVDDNFTSNKERAKDLLRMMIKERVNNNWSAQVRTDIYKDPELLSLMKKTNCTHLYIGFESINPESLVECHKKQSLEDITKAIRAIHGYDMNVHGMFVFGFDSDTKETIRETVNFAKKSKIDTVQFMMLTPLPGTDTYYELDNNDRIFYKNWEFYDAHHAVFAPKNMSPYELQVETIKAMNKFYSLPNVLKTMLSPEFVTGALSFGLRGMETYMFRKLRNLGRFRDAATYLPASISRNLPKSDFYNAIMRSFGWLTARKYQKSLKSYVSDVILKLRYSFERKKLVSPEND